MRQRRVAAGSGLRTALSTTIKYVRRTASGAVGNGLDTLIKYLRRTRNGASGNEIGTTIKHVHVANNCRLNCRVPFTCCGSVAWPQATVRAPA